MTNENWIYGLELWNLSLDVQYETERDDDGSIIINLIEVQIEGQDIGGMLDALDVAKKADGLIIEAVEKHLQDEAKWDEVFADAGEV